KHPKAPLLKICCFLLLSLPGITRSQSFSLTNQLNIHRADEIISIPVKDILHLIPRDRIDQARVRESDQATYLRSQSVDNNLDGKTDELLFLTSIGPRETKTFIIEIADAARDESDSNTRAAYSRFVPERQ